MKRDIQKVQDVLSATLNVLKIVSSKKERQ